MATRPSSAEAREQFHERLRWALRKERHGGARLREPLFPPVEAPWRMTGNGSGPLPDVVDQFERELLDAGGALTRLRDRDALSAYLARFVRDKAVRSAVTGAYPILERLGLFDLLRDNSVTLRTWSLVEDWASALPRAGKDELEAADLGVTGVEWAIAETGSIVISSQPGRARLTSLVPPIHLAVMTPRDLLPGVEDFFTDLRHAYLADPAGSTSNTTLITGPSRTGDIEHQLARGVHGPREVHVIYWEGELPEDDPRSS